MSRKIVSISFLYADERIRIDADKGGKFPLPKIKRRLLSGRSVCYMHPYTAKQFIEHEKIKYADPVLTLSDGSKLRVFLSADPTGPVVESISAIEIHDRIHNLKTRLLKNSKKSSAKGGSKKKPVNGTKRGKDNSNYPFFDFEYDDDYDID